MITWLQSNSFWLLGASNLTISIILFIMATVIAYATVHTKFTKHTDIVVMLTGVATLCYSLSIYRFFWGLDYIAHLLQWKNVMHQWLEMNRWIAVIIDLFALLGMSLVLGPAMSYLIDITKKNLNYMVYTITFVSIIALFWLIMFKVGEWKYAAEHPKTNHIMKLYDPPH